MKLIIILILLGVAGWFGFNSFSKIATGNSVTKDQLSAKRTEEAHPAGPTIPPLPQPPVPPPAQRTESKPETLGDLNKSSGPQIYVEAVDVYTFKNRPVPPPPFGRAESGLGSSADRRGLELSVDSGANSWILRGSPQQVEQLKRIASIVDVEQTELDLDFLLIAVSEDWLRSIGVSAAYQEGAAWLPSFSLDASGASLRIASDAFSIDVSAQASNSSARLVSSPVVRCVTGEPWQFSADQQIPVAALQRSEGVVSTSYNYQSIGLGFSGTVQKAGPKGAYRLNLNQRNGNVENTVKDATAPPAFRSQMLQTSLVIELGRWSCIGGVSSWSIEKQKKLFGASEKEAQDLLLIFVRPRDSLNVAPRAYPVGTPPGHLSDFGQTPWQLSPTEHPLLPAKGWREWPDGIKPKGLPVSTK